MVEACRLESERGSMNLPEIRLLAEIDDLTRYVQEPDVTPKDRECAEQIIESMWNRIAEIESDCPPFQLGATEAR